MSREADRLDKGSVAENGRRRRLNVGQTAAAAKGWGRAELEGWPMLQWPRTGVIKGRSGQEQGSRSRQVKRPVDTRDKGATVIRHGNQECDG